MKRAAALSIAQNLIGEIGPGCDRIQIAGSLRRGTRDVKDIEIVAIPNRVQVDETDMFNEVISSSIVSSLDTLLDAKLISGSFAWEKDEGVKRWGPRYRRLSHLETGISCDLFLTLEPLWAYTLTIRTGPAKFSQAIVTLALRRGWHFTGCTLHLHAKIRGKPCPQGEKCAFIKPLGDEPELFNALGLPWCEPAERSADWLWVIEKNRVIKEDL